MPNIITCHWIKIQCIKKEMKFVNLKKNRNHDHDDDDNDQTQSHIYTEIEHLP